MDSHSQEEGSHDQQGDSSLDDIPGLVSDGGEELLSQGTEVETGANVNRKDYDSVEEDSCEIG